MKIKPPQMKFQFPPDPENSPVFDPNDMQRRSERLKREGRMPPLAEFLKAVQKAAAEHQN
jgi:hypothetical protein